MKALTEKVAAIAAAEDRTGAARDLARFLGGEDALLFVSDTELGVYLPAAGFPRTLSARSGWRELVSRAASEGRAEGEMISPYTAQLARASAVAGGNAVLVVLGGAIPEEQSDGLPPLIALLGHSMAVEQQEMAQRGQLALFTDAAREAGRLAVQLDLARRELERRVAERTAELEDAVGELHGFTYNVAHDLRAPLRAVVATSRILMDELGAELAPEHREMLQRQAFNARRLAVLVDELLKMSRVSRQDMRRSPLDLSEVARRAAAEVLHDHPESRATVDVQPGLQAHADANLMMLLLANLIDNAVKFSPPDARVEVRGSDGVFSVRDYGPGFDMAYVHKIFLPFERLVGIEEVPGTGVGLANVKRIVERHGGRVWAESRPGEGATFYFTLGA